VIPNPPNDPPPPPIPPPARGRLDYQRPGPAPGGSQWWTDEHAYGAAMVYALLALTVIASLLGVLWWAASHLLGKFFGW
jgi:hypothetical protein